MHEQALTNCVPVALTIFVLPTSASRFLFVRHKRVRARKVRLLFYSHRQQSSFHELDVKASIESTPVLYPSIQLRLSFDHEHLIDAAVDV